MSFKNLLYCAFFLIVFVGSSQEGQSSIFGKPSAFEFSLKSYTLEPEVPGVILYESGNYYAKSFAKLNMVRLVKEVHRKIKVFDAKKFDYGTVEIPYYKGNDFYGEEILDYQAITHNGEVKNFIPNDAFYKTRKPGIGDVLKFTFPNIKDGSILEYKYTIVSPYFFDLDGWEFQHDLPTIYSIFQTVLPTNFKYNQILYGKKKLTAQKTFTKKNSFLLPNNSGHKDAEVSIFAMKNVPSFTEEDYMLSKKNYISRIVYEPKAFKAFYGRDQVFTRNWKDVDERFENDVDFGEQLSQKNYFRRKMPNAILKIENDLDRAKAVYKFIQDEYTWNGRNYNYQLKVRDAFKKKLGSVTAINLSLVNALLAAKLKAKPVLLSTRQNGLPTELYPVLSNFNYVLTVLMINNQRILLDATNKQAPFGVIPFRALNVEGRVMDFKNGSYWMPIIPYKKNILYANAQITANANGNFNGKVSQANYGYIALGKRNEIEENTLVEYLKTAESQNANIEVENYKVENLKAIEKPLKESYDVSIEPETVGDKVVLYPFFNETYISENPFKMKERSYPMDFGFPFTNTYLISIDLGNIYKIGQLPKSRTVKLPNEDGECTVTYVSEGNKINIRFSMKLNAYRFPPDAYQSLKKYFGTMVTMLKNEPITLKKVQ